MKTGRIRNVEGEPCVVDQSLAFDTRDTVAFDIDKSVSADVDFYGPPMRSGFRYPMTELTTSIRLEFAKDLKYQEWTSKEGKSALCTMRSAPSRDVARQSDTGAPPRRSGSKIAVRDVLHRRSRCTLPLIGAKWGSTRY
jgi:hypothetical protein